MKGGLAFITYKSFVMTFSFCCVRSSWVFSVVFTVIQCHPHEGMVAGPSVPFRFNIFIIRYVFLGVVFVFSFPRDGL